MHTHTEPIVLTSHPVNAAGGLRMMARHLATGIDPWTAHSTRLAEVADDVEALLVDAVHLVGEDQHDRHLWRLVEFLRDAAEGGPPRYRTGDHVTRAGLAGTDARIIAVDDRHGEEAVNLTLQDRRGGQIITSARNVRLTGLPLS